MGANFNPDDLRDEQLVSIARGDFYPEAKTVSDMADEILRLRRWMRGDSRRSQQVRRLRWAVENALVKVEHLLERVSAPVLETGSIGAMLERLVEDVQELESRVAALPQEDDRG